MKIKFYCEEEDGSSTNFERVLPEDDTNMLNLIAEFRYFLKAMGYLDKSVNAVQHIQWHDIEWNTDDLEIGDWILVCNENTTEVWANQYSEHMFENRNDITHWAKMPYAYGEYIWRDEVFS